MLGIVAATEGLQCHFRQGGWGNGMGQTVGGITSCTLLCVYIQYGWWFGVNHIAPGLKLLFCQTRDQVAGTSSFLCSKQVGLWASQA